MRTILAAALSWSSARSLVAPRAPLRRVASSMGGTSSRADVLDALRSVDSEALLNEVARRGLDAGDASAPGAKRPRQEHVVGELRAKDESSDAREAELRAALGRVGVDYADLAGGPPLKAYHTYCRPRSGGDASQSAENAAHQIAFLQRHELARRDEHFRNTDLAAQGRKARGEAPHRIHVVLDNVRSAENVGSIFRSADCGRCLEVVTCGSGQHKRAKFPTSKAPLLVVFHSIRLIFGRAIISRNGLEAWMLFPERAPAKHSH